MQSWMVTTERHGTSGGKSDRGDAHVLAEIVRLDRAHHRPAAGDSDVAEATKLATRAHQTMIWSRQRTVNMLRSTLREFYPAALAVFDDLADRDALAVLAVAPTPAQGAALTQARVEKALRRGGRQRYVASRAAEIVAGLRAEQLPVRAGLVAAYGASVSALLAVITTMVEQTQVLHEQVAQGFGQHPDVEIYLSQPGLGSILAPRVLAEFGDDPHRYAAPLPQNYAGTAPITRPRESPVSRPVRSQSWAGRRPASTSPLRPDQLARSPRPLRPATRHRRRTPQSPEGPEQPPGRHPARLPETPHHLRRGHSLGRSHDSTRRLTFRAQGCLCRRCGARVKGALAGSDSASLTRGSHLCEVQPPIRVRPRQFAEPKRRLARLAGASRTNSPPSGSPTQHDQHHERLDVVVYERHPPR